MEDAVASWLPPPSPSACVFAVFRPRVSLVGGGVAAQVAKGVLLICVPLQVLPGRLRPEYGVQLRVKL